MAKPIFIVIAPDIITNAEIEKLQHGPLKSLKDEYHCLAVRGAGEIFDFKMFNAENIEESEVEEIKQIIENINKKRDNES